MLHFFFACSFPIFDPVMKERASILLSTAYLPPVEYFVRIFNADKISIEVEETYPKQTYRNRCDICSSAGKLSLSIPINKPNGNHTKTKDIKIENGLKWQLTHWRAIVSAYNHSPYFLYYRDSLESFYYKEFNHLIDYNLELLNLTLEWINLERKIDTSKVFEKNTPEDIRDYRYLIHPKKEASIELKPYTQIFSDRHGFIPKLSILDVIFNLGPDTLDFIRQH